MQKTVHHVFQQLWLAFLVLTSECLDLLPDLRFRLSLPMFELDALKIQIENSVKNYSLRSQRIQSRKIQKKWTNWILTSLMTKSGPEPESESDRSISKQWSPLICTERRKKKKVWKSERKKWDFPFKNSWNETHSRRDLLRGEFAQILSFTRTIHSEKPEWRKNSERMNQNYPKPVKKKNLPNW